MDKVELRETVRKASLGACSVALWTANEGLFVHFTLRIPPKSTVGVLLVPLFGQFQKKNSQKFARPGFILKVAALFMFEFTRLSARY